MKGMVFYDGMTTVRQRADGSYVVTINADASAASVGAALAALQRHRAVEEDGS